MTIIIRSKMLYGIFRRFAADIVDSPPSKYIPGGTTPHKGLAVAAIIAGVVLLIIVAAIAIWLFIKKRNKKTSGPTAPLPGSLDTGYQPQPTVQAVPAPQPYSPILPAPLSPTPVQQTPMQQPQPYAPAPVYTQPSLQPQAPPAPGTYGAGPVPPAAPQPPYTAPPNPAP